ncbi:MAG: F0F1 ATP synthase subunit epsilon [Candidatus Berkelbacteria bacterium]|nr:F0F1 ATP synthase subunit epsilon [Candidatus Berkelbacteria bacterium]
MANKLHLKITTPEKVIFEGDVDEVLVPGSNGELGILPNHTHILANLKVGELKIKKEGTWDHFAIMGGFVEVGEENNIKILADAAEHAEDIDEAKAMEAKERAESLLKEKREDVKFTEASVMLERSLARIRVAQRKKKYKAKTY